VLDRQAKRIVVLEPVQFETRSDRLLPRSNAVLDGVAAVLRDHPEIARLRVEGHTDARGKPAFNQELSRRRAAAVRAYLVSSGVAAARLSSRGWGTDRPVADNATEAGRARNRRVEFVILETRK
jgi:outer membrane protein OmpA-like peptidoglycan-associated protein